MRRLVGLFFMTLAFTLQVSAQNSNRIFGLAWSPDGTKLALATSIGVSVYDVTAEPEMIWSEEIGSTNVILFSPSGEQLAVGLGNGTGAPENPGEVRILDSASGSEIHTFEANDFAIYDLAFSPDGERLMTGGGYIPTRAGGDYRVRVWNTATWEEIEALQGEHVGAIRALAYSPDGQFMASNGGYGFIALRNAQSGELLSAIQEAGAGAITFSPDSRLVTLAFYDSLQVWEIRAEPEWHLVQQYNWRYPRAQIRDEWLLTSVFFGQDHEVFATATSNGRVQVRDAQTGQVVASYQEEGDQAAIAAFSPDGARLAFVGGAHPSPPAAQVENKVVIWTLSGEQETIPLPSSKTASMRGVLE